MKWTTAAKPAAWRILLPTYWNVFVDGVVARSQGQEYEAMSREVTREIAATQCSVAAEAGARCVDLAPVFRGPSGTRDATPLLQDDGDHPKRAGHAAIARALAARGWPDLEIAACPAARDRGDCALAARARARVPRPHVIEAPWPHVIEAPRPHVIEAPWPHVIEATALAGAIPVASITRPAGSAPRLYPMCRCCRQKRQAATRRASSATAGA
jgi:hypothetical protein